MSEPITITPQVNPYLVAPEGRTRMEISPTDCAAIVRAGQAEIARQAAARGTGWTPPATTAHPATTAGWMPACITNPHDLNPDARAKGAAALGAVPVDVGAVPVDDSRPCRICGDPVLWYNGHPIQYHDCKPVPLARLEAETARADKLAAGLNAERDYHKYKQRLIDSDEWHAGYAAGIADQAEGRAIAEEYRDKAEAELAEAKALASDLICQRQGAADRCDRLETELKAAKLDRETMLAQADKVREQLAARVRYLEAENERLRGLLGRLIEILRGEKSTPEEVGDLYARIDAALAEGGGK